MLCPTAAYQEPFVVSLSEERWVCQSLHKGLGSYWRPFRI